MKLIGECITAWPKLAWVARAPRESEHVHVLHGPMVETHDDWFVEAVWDGDFAEGGFDQADLVFGTGIRCRSGKAVFVASATGVECLWFCDYAGVYWVSNSMPALLAAAGISLNDDYPHYDRDIYTIETKTLLGYKRTLPATPHDIHLMYYNNLVFDGKSLLEVDKPNRTPPFSCYSDYHGFLMESAEKLKLNMRSTSRRDAVDSLVGISLGYDSPAAAVVARQAGCTKACTITRANSLWRGSDNGKEIAAVLRMQCTEHKPHTDAYRRETTTWAVAGRSGGLNMTLFDYPQPLCVFFSGSYGDHVWDKYTHDMKNPAGNLHSFPGEFRLSEGVFYCVVPWWGIRRAEEINKLGSSDEMKPWVMGNSYDRPVARRLVEEAGVPRRSFGILKKNTSSNTSFRWPFAIDAQESLTAYRRRMDMYSPPGWLVGLIRRLALLDTLFFRNVTRRFGIKKGWRPWSSLSNSSMLFRWANSELKKDYEKALIQHSENGESPGE